MRDVVLLVTHSADFFTVDRVAESLRRRGVHPVRLDTDLHPTQIRLINRPGGDCRLIVGDEAVDRERVRALWMRKVAMPRLPDDLDERFRAGAVREGHAAMIGFLDQFHDARVLDPLDRSQAGENKPRQLRLAAACGLDVPRTLITNDAEEARAFFHSLGGRVVAKMLTPLTVSMGKPEMFVYTSPVEESDLEDAESLRYSPMVFQERIEKARELRVIYVAGRCFSGAIDAGRAKHVVDWRTLPVGESPWIVDELPDEVAQKFGALMKQLGLDYGAADIIRTPEGRHLFLEVNPSGEWGMIERDLELPIADAIAEALLK